MNHRTKVVTGTKGTLAMCSCGWHGQFYTEAAKAKTESNDHVIETALKPTEQK